MVQRILMLALVLLAFTMPIEAITLQELQTSPQFKLVHVQAMNPTMDPHSILCVVPIMS